MMMHIFNPTNLRLKKTVDVVSHNISLDYVTNTTSTFVINDSNVDIYNNDIIEIIDESYFRSDVEFNESFETKKDYIKEKIIYLGIVSNYDNNSTITTTYIYNIFNAPISFEKMDGKKLINALAALDHSKYTLPPIVFGTLTAGDGFLKSTNLLNNESKYMIMNLVDLIIEAHKQSGAILLFDIKQTMINDRIENALYIDIKEKPTKNIWLKDNTDFMKDISLVYEAGPSKANNAVEIRSKDFNNLEAEYYCTVDGDITNAFDAKLIATPISTKIIYHDENKTYLDEAQSAIGGYHAATNISFKLDLKKYNLLAKNADDEYDTFSIGNIFTLNIGGKSYYTVLTGFEYDNSTQFVKFLFGYQRDTLQSTFREMFKK